MPGRVSLRRSCSSCIKAKRRCDLISPTCGRCKLKRRRCEYDNEPLTASLLPTPPRSPPREVSSGADSDRWGFYSLPWRDDWRDATDQRVVDEDIESEESDTDLVLTRRRHAALTKGATSVEDVRITFLQPVICPTELTLDGSTVRYLLQTLRMVPSSFAKDRKTLFIHPQLIQDMPISRLAAKVFALCACATRLNSTADRGLATRDLDQWTQALVNHTNRTKPGIQDLLVAIQALIMSQITLVLGALSISVTDSAVLGERAQGFKTLTQWTWKIWACAPWSLPNAVDAKQFWLFAESVRRTILASHLLVNIFAVLYTGAFKFTGFISTLPFDARTHLWDDSEELESVLRENVPGEAKSELISFRQLVLGFESGELTSKTVGQFERIFLIACRGYHMVVNRLGVPVPGHWYTSVDTWLGWDSFGEPLAARTMQPFDITVF